MPGLTIQRGVRLALALALVPACGGGGGGASTNQSAAAAASPPTSQAAARVLVFSRTTGYRHGSIPVGKAAVQALGREHGFGVDTTEDAAVFTDRGLAPYGAVVFLSTTGDVLDQAQQDAFERFVRAGRGYVGVHSATDTEYDWPWYGRLAGAYFASHPAIQKAAFVVVDSGHPATRGLPARWEREDELYNFKQIAPDLHVLVTIDETTYQGGTNGASHPMAWYHDVDGGRAFYTAMGHTDASWSEPRFLSHLLGGIRYALGSAADSAARGGAR